MNLDHLDTTDQDLDNWLRRHNVYESLKTLETLAQQEPRILYAVLRLALMMGIHAGYRVQAESVQIAEATEEFATFRNFWKT